MTNANMDKEKEDRGIERRKSYDFEFNTSNWCIEQKKIVGMYQRDEDKSVLVPDDFPQGVARFMHHLLSFPWAKSFFFIIIICSLLPRFRSQWIFSQVL